MLALVVVVELRVPDRDDTLVAQRREHALVVRRPFVLLDSEHRQGPPEVLVLQHRHADGRLQAVGGEVWRRLQVEARADVGNRGRPTAEHHRADHALAVLKLHRVDLGGEPERHDHSLPAFDRRAGQQPGRAHRHTHRGFQRLLLQDLRSFSHRGQRLRDLAQRVQGRIELRSLAAFGLQDPRVLEHDPGHRSELVQRRHIGLGEPDRAVAPEAQGADDSAVAVNRRERLVHGPALGLGLDPAVDVLVGGDEAAQHRLPVANLGQGALDGGGVGRAAAPRPSRLSEHHVRVVRLEEDGRAGVVADHLLALVEHELQRLVHRLAGRLLDELVHQRVARGFPARSGDGVGARQLRAGAQRQSHREPAVVVVEIALLLAQQDEAADLVADAHRHRHQPCDVQVVRQVVDQLRKRRLIVADVLLARLDSAEQRSGVPRVALHRHRMEAIEADARRLRKELPAVGRRGVVAREVGARLPRDDGEGRDVARVLGVVRVRGGRHEGPLLGQELDPNRLQVNRMGADRSREAAVGHASDETTEPEEQKPGQLEDEVRSPQVEPIREEGDQQRCHAERNRALPVGVERSRTQRQQARHDGEELVRTRVAGDVQRRADQHEGGRGRRKADAECKCRPF